MSKINVRKDYVLIAEAVKEEKTSGGIILSSGAQVDKASKPCVVLAYGPNCSTDISVGDRVYLEWPKSMPITHDDKAAVLIEDKYVKAFIRN